MKLNGLKSCPTLVRGTDEHDLFYDESSFSVSPLLPSSEPDPVIKVHSISSIINCTFIIILLTDHVDFNLANSSLIQS